MIAGAHARAAIETPISRARLYTGRPAKGVSPHMSDDLLHIATTQSLLQILPALAALVDKAEAHCRETGAPAASLTMARLAPDMWPFSKQIIACCRHSAGAIDGVQVGIFRPDTAPPPEDFATLRTEIADAIAYVETVKPGTLADIAERDMTFEFGPRRMDFTVEGFLLTFSLPNFYFHASIAYAVLRNHGLAVGKGDFLGKPRLRA